MPSKILPINPAQLKVALKASQRKEQRPKPPGLLPTPQRINKDSQKSLLSQQMITAKYVQNGFQATGLGFGKRSSKPIAGLKGGMRSAEGRSESKIESYRQRIARLPIEEFVKAYNSAPPKELEFYREIAAMHILSARHFGGLDGGGGRDKTAMIIRLAQLGGINNMDIIRGAMNTMQEIIMEDWECSCFDGLIWAGKELSTLMERGHIEKMGEEAQEIITRTYATVWSSIPLYSKYLDRELPVCQETRIDIWEKSESMGRMRRENPAIGYEAMRAIEAVKRLRSDRPLLMEHSGRIVHLCQMATALYRGDMSGALGSIIELFKKFPLGRDWFYDSLFFQKVVYLTKNGKEGLSGLQIKIKEGIEARSDVEWMYGAIQSLRDTAVRTLDRETQLQVLQGTGEWRRGNTAGGLYELSQFNRYRMKNNWKVRFRAIQAITEIMVLTGDEKIREEIGLYLEKVSNNDEDERVKKTAETGHRKYLKIKFATKGKKQAKARQINWEREAEVWGIAEYKESEPSVPQSAPQSEPAGLDEKKEPEADKWYEGIELEPEYMCPVLRRPMVDAVTLWPSNQRVSEEAATKIMAGNKKCPKTRAEITGYKADAEFRGIVAEKCRAKMSEQGKAVPIEDAELAELKETIEKEETELRAQDEKRKKAQEKVELEKQKQELRKKQAEIAKAKVEAKAEEERLKAEAELMAMQAKVKNAETDLKAEEARVAKIGVSDKQRQELEALRRKQAELEKSKADMEKKRKEKEAQQAKYLEDQKKLEQAKNEAERRISSMERESRGQEIRIAQLKQEREKMEQQRIEAEAQFQRLQKEKEVKAAEAARLERERAVEVRRMQELKEKAERERISLAAASPVSRGGVEEKKEVSGIMNEAQIRQLMGERYIGPEALAKAWGAGNITGIPAIPAALTPEIIQKAGENHILVCVPDKIKGQDPSIMSLKAQLWKQAESQYQKEKFSNTNWYNNEEFATKKIKAGWYLIRTDVPRETRSKTYQQQEAAIQQYKNEGYETLEVGPAVFGMLMYNLQTGKNDMLNLRDNNLAWCKEQSGGGVRVDVRFDDGGGLRIGNDSDAYRSNSLGRGLLRNF